MRTNKTPGSLRAEAFIEDGFEYAGMKFRPMSATTLLLLEIVESPFFTGEGSAMRGLLDYLLIQSMPVAEARKLVKNPDRFEEAVMDFGEKFTTEQLKELDAMVSEASEAAVASVAEPESSEKKP